MIWIILFFGFIARTYRVSDFLGFWFDQGRDALVISNLLQHKDFFLIGPTTGIEGIFLGPFYYYLIAPFYALGRGDPIYPAIFIAILNTGAIYLMYRLARRYVGHWAGIIAATLYAFSFHWIGFSRWLANPTPLPFFAVASLWWVTSLVHSDKRWWLWPALGLGLGLSLQLEAASAIFFLPVVIILFAIYRKNLVVDVKKTILLIVFFGLTLTPQLFFNFRNQNILGNSFYKFLVTEKSFQPEITNFYIQRLAFYFEAFTNKFVLRSETALPLTALTLVMFVVVWRKLPQPFTTILLLWWLTPVVVLLFYHGNKGYVWDYYFTGVYPALCILAGSVYWTFFTTQKNVWHFLPVVLIAVILGQNIPVILTYYKNPVTPYVNLTNIVAAVDWVYQDAGSTPFNTDEYVPPVIPYAYEYVFQWRGLSKFGRLPNTELVKKLYILREPDPGHQTLLNTWMTRQAGIGSIEQTIMFGPITAERRVRFNVNSR